MYGFNQNLAYQNRLQQMQAGQFPQFQPQRQFQPYQPLYQSTYPQGLRGRAVTGREEAVASQVEMDGVPTFFPALNEGRIYVKNIDLNGNSVIDVYERQQVQDVPKQEDVITAMQARIDVLERKLEGVLTNDKPNANYANATGKPKSNDVPSAAVRE